MHKISFEIETLSPVIISSANTAVMTSTHSEISGSAIRGALAKKFIAEKNLQAPHLDQDFKKFFYGDLNFLSATPKILNQRSFVLPLSLQSGKKGTADENKISDLLKAEEVPQGYKSFRGYGVSVDDKIFKADVKKNISLHMSRSLENERLSGKSEEGHIFNYESIDAGQIFCGEIIGSEIELQQLADALNFDISQVIFLGKSRATQYGKCKITFGDVEKINLPTAEGTVFLRLDSPLISTADYFIDAEKVLQAEVVDILNNLAGKNIFTLGKVFSACVEVEKKYQPKVLALAAGTVFEIKLAEAFNFAEKIYSGFGVRNEEGFGQARFWQAENFTHEKLNDTEPVKPEKFSAETVEIAKKILLARCLEQVRIYAYDDAEKLKLRGEHLTHFFSRLDNILSSFENQADAKKNFQLQIKSEIRGGSLFETNLKILRMANGQTFFDVLTGEAEIPRSVEDLKKDLHFETLLEELGINLDFVQEKIFAEYFKQYFRVARKLSAKGGDDFE